MATLVCVASLSFDLDLYTQVVKTLKWGVAVTCAGTYTVGVVTDCELNDVVECDRGENRSLLAYFDKNWHLVVICGVPMPVRM